MAKDAPAFTLDSLGWIASMSKIVTTVAVMQIVEKGLISLDDNTRPLVPQLRDMKLLRGFDEDENPIFEDLIDPITLR